MLTEYLKHSIIVAHNCGDGGNFLINCLAMSDKIYYKNLDKKNKISYFFSGIIKQKESWSDICMWTNVINPNLKYLDEFISFFPENNPPNSKDFLIKLHYPTIFDESLVNGLKFMNYCLLEKKYLIVFTNSKLFSCLRHFFDDNGNDAISRTCIYDFFYQDLFNNDIPKNNFLNNITIKEYSSFSDKEKDKLKELYELKFSDIIFFMNSLLINDSNNLQHVNSFQNKFNFIWDTNWFLDEDDTALNIQKLYQNLKFDDYDEKLIRKMYRAWIQKLDEIKINHRNLK
jgi:hypothetical protein